MANMLISGHSLRNFVSSIQMSCQMSCGMAYFKVEVYPILVSLTIGETNIYFLFKKFCQILLTENMFQIA